MSKPVREKMYPLIAQKQKGEYCVYCKKDLFILKECGRSPILYIDHIDNNDDNNHPSNLQLLCVSCNTTKNHPSKEIFIRSPTPEYRDSKKNQIAFRNMVFGKLITEEHRNGLQVDRLVNNAAERLDCSQQAIKNYILKMTSDEGMYTIETRLDGEDYLVFKEEYR